MSNAPRKIIRRPEVEQRTGLGRAAIYELMSDGLFPRQVPLGPTKSVGWLEHEVEDWIEARIAERDLPPDQRPKPVRRRIRKRTRRPATESHAAA